MPIELVSDADKERIVKALADLTLLEAELEKATKAGIDVSEQTTKTRALKAKWLQLKEVYVTPE